tara:strand:- start:199 stop:459 length:261 start_codon:yes stop_codon:yes gene_type:complete
VNKACENCSNARKLVNSNRPKQVACRLGRIETHEEALIEVLEVSDYSMYFKNAKPESKKRGVMCRGILVPRDFKCNEYKEDLYEKD